MKLGSAWVRLRSLALHIREWVRVDDAVSRASVGRLSAPRARLRPFAASDCNSRSGDAQEALWRLSASPEPSALRS